MRALLQLTVAAALASGCVHPYTEPGPDEPHALVRVRIVRHRWAGPRLDEAVRLNGYDIAMPPAGPDPSIRAMRIRPEPTRWRFSTTFFHTVQRLVYETYNEQYPCGSYSSGVGSSTYSQTRYCTRTRTRQRWVTDRVVDAACIGDTTQVPMAGAAYLVQFDFYDHQRCRARCLRQLPAPDGTFRFVPCGPTEPPPGTEAPPSASTVAVPPPPGTTGGESPFWQGGRPTNRGPTTPAPPPNGSGGTLAPP